MQNIRPPANNFEFDFLPYKPGALHPVASAPINALTRFCLSPLLADEFKPPALRVVVDFIFDSLVTLRIKHFLWLFLKEVFGHPPFYGMEPFLKKLSIRDGILNS